MGVTIILICVIIVGIIVGRKSTRWNDNDVYGGLMCFAGVILLVLHLILWASASVEYERYVQTRQAFVSTLENARKIGSPHEVTAIAKDIAKWNIELADYKFRNSRFLGSSYIDDRFETLEPIK